MFLTNFPICQLELYQEAVKTYPGGKDFAVSKKSNTKKVGFQGSLHYFGERGTDLSDFWSHFEKIEAAKEGREPMEEKTSEEIPPGGAVTGIKDLTKKAFEGFSIISNSITNSNIWPFILAGEYDDVIKCGVYYNHTRKQIQPGSDGYCYADGKIVTEEDVFNHTFANEALDNLKNLIRRRIQQIFDQAAKDEAKEKQLIKENEMKGAREKYLNDISAVSEFGTVAVISEKYGISKKQVRKMKNEGTLKSFIESQLQS